MPHVAAHGALPQFPPLDPSRFGPASSSGPGPLPFPPGGADPADDEALHDLLLAWYYRYVSAARIAPLLLYLTTSCPVRVVAIIRGVTRPCRNSNGLRPPLRRGHAKPGDDGVGWGVLPVCTSEQSRSQHGSQLPFAAAASSELRAPTRGVLLSLPLFSSLGSSQVKSSLV